IIDEYKESKQDVESERIAQALISTIKRLVKLVRELAPDAHCYLTFGVTDGKRAAVSHCSTDPDYADTLYLNQSGHYEIVKGMTAVLPRRGTKTEAVLVASEPLSKDPGWRRVGMIEVLVIDEDLTVTTRDIM